LRGVRVVDSDLTQTRDADVGAFGVTTGEDEIRRLIPHVEAAHDPVFVEVNHAHRVRDPVHHPGFALVPHGDADGLKSDRDFRDEYWRVALQAED
jgi:hypothetical protein